MKIVIVGNCQVAGLARCMKVMNPRLEVDCFDGASIQKDAGHVGDRLHNGDFIFVQTGRSRDFFRDTFPKDAVRAILYPRIYFAAYHPDIVYLRSEGELVETPLSHYNSKLVLSGYLNGLTIDETVALFDRRVFQRIGYFDSWEGSASLLRKEVGETNLDLGDVPLKWSRTGCFMHSVNHPKLFVLADIARAMLASAGLEVRTSTPEHYLEDELKLGPIWPVYPEIAQIYGIEGDYCFKASTKGCEPTILSLVEFVERTFSVYAKFRKDNFDTDYFDMRAFSEVAIRPEASNANLAHDLAARTSRPVSGGQGAAAMREAHPYTSIRPYQIWGKAVASVPMRDVDPVVPASLEIRPQDKVASVGSCFAQHISRGLQSADLNYYMTEARPPGMSVADATNRSFGIFSARYGNVYTARQLVQLMDRAFCDFTPRERPWRRPDGKFVDPFRPTIEPEGYETEEEVDSSRHQHLGAVRDLFETLDVLVVTLGLTEAWRSTADGSVFPVAPGVVAGHWDPAAYEFVNFGADEVARDLEGVLQRLAKINPGARLLLTISPVPLVATYEDRHVLVSTTYSKSALRVAADIVCRANDNAHYFPAYEIIASSFSRGEYFAPDLRSVTPGGVEHVMRLFLKHFYSRKAASIHPGTAELSSGIDIFCDEELLVIERAAPGSVGQ